MTELEKTLLEREEEIQALQNKILELIKKDEIIEQLKSSKAGKCHLKFLSNDIFRTRGDIIRERKRDTITPGVTEEAGR